MKPIQKVMAYLGISIASSFAFAITWVILMTLTLPKTDLAHGQMPFKDPLVFPIMTIFAVVSGLLAWPFYTLLGWNRPPKTVGIIAGIATFVFIIIATPLNAGIGWVGSYFALLSTLLYCRFNRKLNGQPSGGAYGSPAEGSPSAHP
jgi:hypothetical protein